MNVLAWLLLIIVTALFAFDFGKHVGARKGRAEEQLKRILAVRRSIGIRDDEDVPQIDLLIHHRPELGAEEIHRRLLGP